VTFTGHPTRTLLIVSLMAACGCRSEPNGPAAPPASGQPPVSKASDPRPGANAPAPGTESGPAATKNDPAADFQAMMHAMGTGQPQPLPQPPLTRVKAISTGDPELDPLVSFLKGYFAEDLKAGKTLVIEDRTSIDRHAGSPDDYLGSLLAKASDEVPAEMIRDHVEKNRESRPTWLELGRHVPVRLLSREEYHAIFTDGPDENWKRFYKRYPDATGIITISRVGLSRDKVLALFYMGVVRGPLNGEGQLNVVKKKGDEWVEQPIRIGPSWVS
jgi:hypothetical protein